MAVAPRALLLMLLLTPLFASPAKAWTRARVTGAKAHVAVSDEGQANVRLDLVIDVDAGWLAEFEVTGLDRDLVVNHRRLRFRSREGLVKVADVETDPATGTIRAIFDRESAPRQGTYDVSLRYEANLISDDTETVGGRFARIAWTMPAWEHSLQDAEITVVGPRNIHRSSHSAELPPGTTLSTKRGERTRLTWRRIHLPRTRTWSVHVDTPLPRLRGAPPTSSRPTAAAPMFASVGAVPFTQVHWPTLLLLLLVLWKRLTLRGRPLLLQSPAVATSVLAGSAVIAVFVPAATTWHWLLGTVALLACVSRRERRSHGESPAHWEPCSLNETSARTRSLAPLDVTTLPGLAIACIVTVILGSCGHWTEAMLALPIFFTGTRFDLSPDFAEQKRLLRRFTNSTRFALNSAPIALAPVTAKTGSSREVRVSVVGGDFPSSLLRLEWVVATRSYGILRRRTVQLHVATRAESALDDLLRPRLDAIGDRIASQCNHHWLVPAECAQEIAKLCARQERSSNPPLRESGTWLLDALSERRGDGLADAA